MEYPKLRSIDVFPYESSGQKVVGLRDPSRLDDKVLLVSYPVFFVISLLDGTRSLIDIKADYMRKFGDILYTERLQEIIAFLDDHYLLDNERFATYRQKIEEKFRAATVRKAVFAGSGYSSDPHELIQQIEGFFTAPTGPGRPDTVRRSDPLKGLIAPHIDYKRGGTCYAWPYRVLLESPQPDLFVILGTAHLPTANPFVLTRKNFETPLGMALAEAALIESLVAKLPFDPFQDEIVHMTEHSIELQLLFLKYCLPEPTPLRIIPVLCSSFHGFIAKNLSPLEHPAFRAFVTALRETLETAHLKTCFIASADLSHCGIRFGDPTPPSDDFLRNLERDDRSLLSLVAQMDTEAFYASIQSIRDRSNICGLPPIYTLLSLLAAARGDLLDYQQSVEPGGASVVTFASAVFT